MAFTVKRNARVRTCKAGDVEYRVGCCVDDHVHIELPQLGKELTLGADEAWQFAQDILKAYDEAVGIAAPPVRNFGA